MLSTSPRPTSTPSVGAMGNVPGRNWMQGGPSPQAPMTTPTMSHQAGPMMQNRSPQVPGMQPQPGQPMPSHDLGVPQQAQGPPRTATTPINPPRQNGIQGTPAMANLIREAGNIIGVQQIAGTGQRPYQGIAPLSQQAFFTAHKNFLDRQGVPLDKRQPSIQGIPVDLHYLHSEVMRAGGPHNVSYPLISIPRHRYSVHYFLACQCVWSSSRRCLCHSRRQDQFHEYPHRWKGA